jgi:hypothetical protein
MTVSFSKEKNTATVNAIHTCPKKENIQPITDTQAEAICLA